MKLNKIDILVTKIELKENKEGKAYLLIDMLDMLSGDSFNILSKDIELMSKLKMMNKYKINLELTSNKYGLKLEIKDILDELGAI